MADFLMRISGLIRQDPSLRAFMERSNMEVMNRVAPVTCVMSVIFLLSTFTSLPLWDLPPDDIMMRYRVMFSLMATGAFVCSHLSRRYLSTRNPTPGRGELILLLCVVYFVSLGVWITIADFAQLGRYFVMLSTLFVVFGLFFVPVIHTLLCELIVFAVTMLSLMNIGYFAPIQVVTLACYLLIILAVSASNYSARLRAGVTTLEIMRASRETMINSRWPWHQLSNQCGDWVNQGMTWARLTICFII